MGIDRTLQLSCTPTLIWAGDGSITATMAYTQTGSVPAMNNAVDARTGNINLRHMPANNLFTDNVDISLYLDTSKCVDQNGNPIAVRWALPTEGNPPDDVGAIWFVANPAPGQPKNLKAITINGMSASRLTDSILLIDDNTAVDLPGHTSVYTFCMAIVIPSRGNYYITIDPAVVGKGTSSK